MKRTVIKTHEIFDERELLSYDEDVFLGDVGTLEIGIVFTRNGVETDISDHTLTITNLAPNGRLLTYVADGSPATPVAVDGSTVKWVLGGFDSAQAGTYTAQVRLLDGDNIATVVMVKYNVERSVTGELGETPAVMPSVNEFVERANELIPMFDDLLEMLEDNGVTWSSLVGKPAMFPPSPHTHTEFDQFAVIGDRIDGIVCEIANKVIAVDVGAWAENTVALRYEAVIEDEVIRTDTDVDLQLSDAQNGLFSIQALRPSAGSLTIYTNVVPKVALEFVMSVTEVRTNA